MPKLRAPAGNVAGDFATMVRKIAVPYRLVDERDAIRKPGARVGNGAPCGYCGVRLKKTGLKFCSRTCYLRHSVEVARPTRGPRQSSLRCVRGGSARGTVVRLRKGVVPRLRSRTVGARSDFRQKKLGRVK
jgi:hypothetical protein